MANIGKVVIGPSQAKNVIVRPINRTTISSPNFTPRVNVSIENIQSLNVSSKNDGDVILYNSETGEYVSSPLRQAQVDITNINGGNF
jgi:hypothetical protein